MDVLIRNAVEATILQMEAQIDQEKLETGIQTVRAPTIAEAKLMFKQNQNSAFQAPLLAHQFVAVQFPKQLFLTQMLVFILDTLNSISV